MMLYPIIIRPYSRITFPQVSKKPMMETKIEKDL